MNSLIRQPVANLYAERDPASELVSQLLMGSAVVVLESIDEWRRIAGPDGYRGWASAADLVPVLDGWPGNEKARIAALYANVRHAPSSRSGPRACIPFGVTLPVADRSDGWMGLRLPNGEVGWLEAGRVESPLPRPASAASVLATARMFLGVPYLWGGTSSFGIDCSGFVQAVCGAHGVELPRDACDQSEWGEPVSRDRIAAGDLVYFAPSPDLPAAQITHVALAVDGSTILHALGSRAVVETPLEGGGPFWGARRLPAWSAGE